MKDHQALVQNEFSRQAGTLATAALFNDERMLDRIREAAGLTRQSRALDVACGPGIVAAALARDAGEVVACDITPEMLARAVRRCAGAGLSNVRCILGEAETLPFADGTFDVAVARSALHHFPRPERALAEMARVLRPSGRVVIVDVMSAEDAEDSALHNALEMLRDPSHVRMPCRSELYAHLQRAGLAVQSVSEWINHREFGEWLKIVNAPQRVAPLRAIMSALAKAGVRAGINLRLENGKLLFEHHPLLLVAGKTG
ncbi:MAG: class I SAM-dependent methyltransferase [Burkholderiales bacterium]